MLNAFDVELEKESFKFFGGKNRKKGFLILAGKIRKKRIFNFFFWREKFENMDILVGRFAKKSCRLVPVLNDSVLPIRVGFFQLYTYTKLY